MSECPKCGAAFEFGEALATRYQCGSLFVGHDEDDTKEHQSQPCRIRQLEAEAAELRESLSRIRGKLESIVCTDGCDAGVVLLSQEGRTHTEVVGGKPCQVYDLEHFSPLGEALIELYKLSGGTVDE